MHRGAGWRMVARGLVDVRMRMMGLTVCAVTVLAGSPAGAAPDKTSFTISARVESVCTAGDARGQTEVRCTRGTAYNLAVNDDRVRTVVRDGGHLMTVSDKAATGIVIATITY
jgi:hypothetical protein